MFEHVPSGNIAAMAVTLAIAVLLPVIAAVFFKKKLKGSLIGILVGACTFIIFAQTLEQVLHVIIMMIFGEKLTGNVVFLAIYGGLAAALFEETGRYLAMKFAMKKRLTKENAIMFGVGHGGCESVLVIGVTYLANIAVSVLINTDKIEGFLTTMDPETHEKLVEQLSALWTTPAAHFILAGAERILAFALQICMSYLVYRALKDKKIIFWFISFGIHFAVDCGLVLLASKLDLITVELILCGTIAVIAVFTVILFRKEKAAEAENGSGPVPAAVPAKTEDAPSKAEEQA
ncbi:MAG: YhfC family intramembrane metalloprotease [Clostridiales bacterium]|nr:YhfC family intramembrane metalloprotease [Clostridiales bacterium]